MGVILYSTFKSSNNIEYTVQILDNQFNAAPSEFITDSPGFVLDYSGETDDIVSPVISSMCTVGMYVENVGQESLLIDNLKLYQEDRYFIRIYKNIPASSVDITEIVVSDFSDRVTAENVTIENAQCVKNDINYLGGANRTIPADATSLYWTGKITQDLVTTEDQYYPYLYQITAVDGIGLLANEDYTTAGNKTIFEVFKESIDLLNIDNLCLK